MTISKTFVKITNEDIYKEIKISHENNSREHNEIIQRLDRTNGKVKLNKWIATTALTIVLMIIMYIVSMRVTGG